MGLAVSLRNGTSALTLAAVLAAFPLTIDLGAHPGFKLGGTPALAKNGGDDNSGSGGGGGSGGDDDDDNSGSGSGGDDDDDDSSGSGSGDDDDDDNSGPGSGGDGDDDDSSFSDDDGDDGQGRGRGRGGDDGDDNSGPGNGGDDDGAGFDDGGNGGLRVVEVEENANGLEVRYSNGVKEEIEGGRYELKNQAGRTVVERPATAADIERLRNNARVSGVPAKISRGSVPTLPRESRAARIEIAGNDIEVTYSTGWREEVKRGRYELKDPSNNTVVERRATAADIDRLMALAGR